MRISALLVVGLLCVPVSGYAQSGPLFTPWDGRGYLELGGGAQGGSHLLTETSTFPLYDEQAQVVSSQSYGGGPLLTAGGGVKVWKNLLVGATYTRVRDTMETAVTARIPNPLFLNRFRDAELREGGLRHTESGVHLSATWMLPLREDLALGVSFGPSIVNVAHEFARDVRVTEASGPPAFDAVAVSDLAFVRSSASGTTVHVGANLAYDLPVRLGRTGRLGANLGFRYLSGSVSLNGATGPVDVKYGGPQIVGGVRVGF
jgi:hypothetical protein